MKSVRLFLTAISLPPAFRRNGEGTVFTGVSLFTPGGPPSTPTGKGIPHPASWGVPTISGWGLGYPHPA